MLGADLRALRNLFRTGAGRKAVLGSTLVLAGMALGSMALSSELLLGRAVLAAVADDESGALVRAFYAVVLAMPLFVTLGAGVSQLRTELYTAAHVPMLLVAPVTSAAIVTRAFLRTSASWLAIALAIGLPPILGLAQRTAISAAPMLALPLASAALAAPIVAAQLLLKIVLVRWFSGRRARLVFTTLNVSFALVLALLIVMGIFNGEQAGERLGAWIAGGGELPWLLRAPAALLAAAAGFDQSGALLASVLALFSLALPLLGLAAVLYRRSVEVDWIADSSGRSATSVRRRGWPESALGSCVRKTLLESLRTRSTIIACAFFALLLVFFLASTPLASARAPAERFPLPWDMAFSLLHSTQFVVFVVASVSFLGLFEDRRQVPLLATSPVPRSALLVAKLLGIASPIGGCVLLAVALAAPLAGASIGAVLMFAAMALPLVPFTVGAVALAGAWPAFLRTTDDVPLAHSMRSVGPALLIAAACLGGLFTAVRARHTLYACCNDFGRFADRDPTLLGFTFLAAEWSIAALVLLAGYRVALANFETLLGPERD